MASGRQRRETDWLLFAIASGGCAACNGVFAKLTTTSLTGSWAGAVSTFLGLSGDSLVVEYLIRAIFLGLNFLFNAIMWGLFTRALTLATSTTRVSVINTSSNFLVTAVLSALIFYEALPSLWWLGAAFLVSGSVIIGHRDEDGRRGEHTDMATELSGTRVDAEPFKDDDGLSVSSDRRVN